MARPPTRLILIASIVAFGGGFQDGYQLSVVNTAEESFKEALNASWQQRFNRSISDDEFSTFWTLAVNVFYVGSLAGVLLVSTVAERFGRRNAILLNNVPSALGTLAMCLWPPTGCFELLAVGRLLTGFHNGLSSALLPLYLTEISAPAYRGFISSFQELFNVSIFVIGSIVGLPEVFGNYRFFMILLVFPVIPLTVHTAVLLGLRETPKHLLLTLGDKARADEAIAFFNGERSDTYKFVDICENEVAALVSRQPVTPGVVKMATLVGVLAAASQTFTAINALDNFSTSIFVRGGVAESTARWATVGQQSIKAIASLTALSFIDRLGRRRLFIASALGCCSCNGLFVLIDKLSSSWNASSMVPTYLLCTVYALHSVFFSFGVGQITWFLASEMVPQAYRSRTQTISTSVMWGSAIVTGVAFYPLHQSEAGSLALLIFIIPALVCALLLFMLMPETSGRQVGVVLEDLERRWRKVLSKKVLITL